MGTSKYTPLQLVIRSHDRFRQEYTSRYGKHHLTIAKCREALMSAPAGMPDNGFVEPPQCMPDEYKESSAIHAYWNYYEKEKHTVRNSGEQLITRPNNI